MSKNIIIRYAEGDETKDETRRRGDETTKGDETGDDKTEWLAFMAHIAHSEVETIQQELQQYKYIIGLETSEYEHYHFYVKMSVKQYSAFAQRIFRKKYALQGRATKGCPRQYGRTHDIKSQQKMATYTCKDKNVRSNMTESEIEEVLGMKLEEVKNTKKKSKYDEMEQYVTKKLNNWHIRKDWEVSKTSFSTRTVKIIIIMYMKENKIMLRRSTIETYYYYFIANSSNENYQEDACEIYDQIYNKFERGDDYTREGGLLHRNENNDIYGL